MNNFLPRVQIIFLAIVATYRQIFFELPEKADTYFAINLGRYILEHDFPYVDPFTIHENLRLVAQQWLSGIVFWEAYKNFGVDGLLFVDAIIGAATVLIFWRLCMLVSGGNKFLSFVISFVAGLFYSAMVVPRPQIFSVTLLLIEVFFLEKFTRTENAKFLIPLPLVSVALINFHAAMWLMSLVVCLPFLFVKNFRHIKFLLAAMIGIFLCGLINPYGLDAITYVFRSYGVDLINKNIAEMFTPTAHDFRGKCFYLVETFLIFSLARGKVPWRYIFLSGGITLMTIMHTRNLALFYFLATFPIAYVWRDLTFEKFKNDRTLMTAFLFLVVAANTAMITAFLQDGLEKVFLPLKILFFAAVLFALYNLLIVKVEGRILHTTILMKKISSLLATFFIVSVIYLVTIANTDSKLPQPYTDAIKFLLRTERPENISLYVPQGFGGLAGSFGIKYYIDSRSEVFLKSNNGQKNIFKEYVAFFHGKINYKDFFARYDFTHIIITDESAFIFNELSADKNFRVIYESERVDGSKVTRCKIFIPPRKG